MIFKNIEIENFRPYFGKQTLSFSTSSSKPVTIVEAPNNWGKTSVYEAIKWCLYDSWPDPTVRDVSINEEAINNYNSTNTRFRVAVTIDIEHEKQNFRMTRWFDYSDKVNVNNPSSNFYVSGTKDGKDIKLDHVQDHQLFINNLLPEEVSRYFIVDGDDFKAFINPTGNKTKEAIEQLLNLKIFERARDHLSTLDKEAKTELARKSGSKDSKKLADNIKKADEEIEKLKEKEEKLSEDKNLAYSQWKRYDEKLQEVTLSAQNQGQLELLKGKVKTVKDQKKFIINECSKRVSNIHYFKLFRVLNNAYTKLGEIREPLDISPFDKPLLEDIVKLCDKKGHVDCICGSSIKKDDINYKAILKKLETLKGVSQKNEILALQMQLKDVRFASQTQKKEIEDFEVAILKADQNLETIESEINKLRAKVDEQAAKNAAALAKQVSDASKVYENLKLDHNALVERIKVINESVEEDRKELEKTIVTDERTKKLALKSELLNDSYNALEKTYDVYRLKKKKELQKKVQEILFKLLTADKLFEKFTIDDDYEYDVLNKLGASWKRRMSNGQKKVLGVSFVAGLKNVANEDAPYIIDSPLNAVDREHQMNYASVLPDLSSQLILFVTDAELQKQTSSILQPKVGKFVKIHWEIVNKKDNRSKFVEGEF